MSRFCGEDVEEVLASFGWSVTPEFVEKYHTDSWVYNLANALVVERGRSVKARA